MYYLAELLDDLGVRFTKIGDGNTFTRITTPADADADSLVFFSAPTPPGFFYLDTAACMVLVGPGWREFADACQHGEVASTEPPRTFFIVDNPRLVITKILREIIPPEPVYFHPTAINDAEFGVDLTVGAYSVIEMHAEIGDWVRIHEHVMIGGPGFGFERDENGRLLHMPHIGRVVIEDDVEIFAHANVDRGTLGETRICRGAKVDHHCHIGHNTYVGEDAMLAAGAILCGGSRVGARTWIGAGARILEGVKVGDDATVGLGAVVIRDVPAGVTVAGCPAKAVEHREDRVPERLS